MHGVEIAVGQPKKNASLSVFCTTVVPRNVLTTKNRSDQSEGVSEDRQWLVTAPYGNRHDVPRGRPVLPGLSTGVQSTCCLGDTPTEDFPLGKQRGRLPDYKEGIQRTKQSM